MPEIAGSNGYPAKEGLKYEVVKTMKKFWDTN